MSLLSRKIWFVVLVGLLLGLACGAVMAVWPELRLAAALVAVVGAVVLGRYTPRWAWFAMGVAPVLAVFAYAANRRWGMSTALIGSAVVAVLSLVVGGISGLWRAVSHPLGCGADCLRGVHCVDGHSFFMCPDTGQPCAKGCVATATPCDRNASVHPNGAPKYQRLPTPEDTRIERLAKLLHNAGRAAVEQGLTQNPSGGAFVEWDDAPERTRAGRRSQATYLLAAGVVLPDDRPAKDPYAWCQPTGLPLKKLRDMLFQADRDITNGKGHDLDEVLAELDADDKPRPSLRELISQIAVDVRVLREPNRLGDSISELTVAADLASLARFREHYSNAALSVEKPTPSQPLQGFPTDEQIREWRYWRRWTNGRFRDVELAFANGDLLDDSGENAPLVLRYSAGHEAASFVHYKRDTWEKAPAPTTTQIAPQAADREAAAK